ncbi:MAG: class II SORL domain-containing protein [Thermoleophilia bacterium]
MKLQQATRIHEAKDIMNMSDIEKKHVPMIHLDDTPKEGEFFDVTIRVGEEISHPNEAEHHVEFIDLYLDDMFLIRCDQTWGYTEPKVTLAVRVDGPCRLRAYERCNLHGDWSNSIDLFPAPQV